MMKGFIHVIEIVIIGLSVFVLLFQFGGLRNQEPTFRETQLLLQARDALATLDRHGIDWFDAGEVNSNLQALLPDNVVFNVRLENVIKPVIQVGCICSVDEFNDIRAALTSPPSFMLNGVGIEFNAQRIDPSNIAFPTRYDVIVVGEYSLAANYKEALRYLADDKGIVEIRDLKKRDIDFTQDEIFGLKWDNQLAPNAPVVFSAEVSKPNSTFHNMPKYFHAFPNATRDTYPEPHTFTFPPADGIDINDNRAERVILEDPRSGAAAAIVNNNIIGAAGRSAWIARGTSPSAGFSGLGSQNDYVNKITFSEYAPLKPPGTLQSDSGKRVSLQACNNNGICEPSLGETFFGCPGECFCGDGVCEEDETCPQDCGLPPACGDGICNGQETTATCPSDCGTFCGDGACNGAESCSSCSTDCGTCPTDAISDISATTTCNGIMVQEECQISFTYRDTSNALVADGVVGLSMPGPGLIGSSCTPGTTMIIRDVTYTHTPPPALWLPPTNPSFPDAEILDTGNFPDVAVTWDLIACPNSAGQYNVIDIAVQEYQGSFILDDGVSFEVLPPAVITSCGNGVIDPGEQCDDGNTAAGDGCDATCQVELLTTCGDGLGNPATCEAPAETCNTCPLDCGPCLPLIPPPGAIPIPDDKAVFLKAVVAWAAGDTFDVIAGNIATNPVSARYVKVYSGDMYQPVEITLTVGSKF